MYDEKNYTCKIVFSEIEYRKFRLDITLPITLHVVLMNIMSPR